MFIEDNFFIFIYTFIKNDWRISEMKKKYKIEVDCAACALKMEEAVKKIEGIKDAAVGFMTQKISVEFEEGADVDAVMEQAVKACKKVEPDCEVYL